MINYYIKNNGLAKCYSPVTGNHVICSQKMRTGYSNQWKKVDFFLVTICFIIDAMRAVYRVLKNKGKQILRHVVLTKMRKKVSMKMGSENALFPS